MVEILQPIEVSFSNGGDYVWEFQNDGLWWMLEVKLGEISAGLLKSAIFSKLYPFF